MPMIPETEHVKGFAFEVGEVRREEVSIQYWFGKNLRKACAAMLSPS